MFKVNSKKTILVTGSNGQLGQEFRKLSESNESFQWLFTTRDSMNILNQDELRNVFSKWQPNYCINCAAYTAVDKAETNKEAAFALNSTAVGNLIQFCSLQNTTFIHYSTDYVYDSVVDRPIQESDICTPRSIYGQSKREGEIKLENSDINWITLRVSWLYSSFKHNFVKTMLRLGREKEPLSIVADQVGSPTYAGDLAFDTFRIIRTLENDPTGINQNYNYSNIGTTNWADFTRTIFQMAKLDCEVHDTSTESYGAPAPRPPWSVMDKSRIMKTFDLTLPTWQESLESCLEILES